MLIELNFEEVKGARVKALKNGKAKNLIPLVICDSSNIADACMKYSIGKNKVPIKFVGDVDILPNMTLDNNYVIIEKAIQEVDISIDFEIAQVDPRVHIVFTLPDDFCNIKAVADACEKYPNIRFIGGKLANVDEVRVGLIELSEFSTKDKSKLPITTNGLEGYAPIFTKHDFDTIEFTHKEKPVKSRKAPRQAVEKDKTKSTAKSKVKTPKKPSLFEQFV